MIVVVPRLRSRGIPRNADSDSRSQRPSCGFRRRDLGGDRSGEKLAMQSAMISRPLSVVVRIPIGIEETADMSIKLSLELNGVLTSIIGVNGQTTICRQTCNDDEASSV